MQVRHVRDVAAMCSSRQGRAAVNRLTGDLLEEIRQDRLTTLLVSEVVDMGLLTEEQVQFTGVGMHLMFQGAGYKEGEDPLTGHDLFLRSKSLFVSRPAVEAWARREGYPINIKGWQ